MPHEQSMAGDILIPGRLLAIFEDVIFRAVGGRDHIDIVVSANLRDGIDCYILGIGEHFRFDPPEVIAFIACVARGSMRLIVIRAMIHDRPISGGKSRGIDGGIKVGEPHDMGELMAEDTDAGEV